MNGRCFRLGIMGLVLAGMLVGLESARAQNNNNNNNQTPLAVAGIEVDPAGVLKLQTFVDRGRTLTRQRIAEARSSLSPDVSKRSELRKISLNRLEDAVRERIERGESPTQEMQVLAGLTRVKYVFYYPETKDIVIAGPAEGWMTDPVGRVRGFETGVPIVELRDLVVALRAFPPDSQETNLISCSIDPTPEGLANMNAFLSAVGTRLNPSASIARQGQTIAQGLRASLGMQTITIKGVSPNTHFAQVLVEADYRMKLIGIGLETPRINLASYVSMASASSVSRNAMLRWFFVPDYACVRVSEDKLGMELVGDGVKLVGKDELVTAEGGRVDSDQVDGAGQRFVQAFTKKYPELAAKEPVYAQLRNMIDLSVAAAYIHQQDFYGQADWRMEVFGDESKLPVETMNAPKQVETAVNSLVKGSRLMTPIGGGVHIRPKKALDSENLLVDEQGQVKAQRDQIHLNELAPGQWWWD